MARILIIGGAGFIGHNMTAELAHAGHETFVFDSFAAYPPSAPAEHHGKLQARLELITGSTIVRGDTLDAAFLTKTTRDVEPEIVVHLADIPVPSEAADVNVRATMNVVEAVRATPSVRRLVYASSSYVYGHFQYEPADEAHALNPIDAYGRFKLANEKLVRDIQRHDCEYTIVRPSAVYGPTAVNGAVSQLFVERALRGEPLVVKNGASRLDFTYVTDTAHGCALAALSENAANEIFNITRGEGRSLSDFVDVLTRQIPGVRVERQENDDESTPRRGTLSIAKARRLLGFEPMYSLERGLDEYVRYVKDLEGSALYS